MACRGRASTSRAASWPPTGPRDRPVAQRRQQRPRHRVQPARRDDHDLAGTEVLDRRPQQRLLQRGGVRLERGHRQPTAGRAGGHGRSAQAVAREVQLVLGPGRRADLAQLRAAEADRHDVQSPVDLDQLDQGGGAECCADPAYVDRRAREPARAAGAQHPATYGRLQPGLLFFRVRCRSAVGALLGDPPGHAAQCGQLAGQLVVVRRTDRRGRERRGPPPFAPEQQLFRVARASGVPGRQCRELGSVDAGPGPHLGGAERQPVLVEHVQAATAGRQHGARVTGSLRLQCAGQPSRGPGDRGTAPARECGSRQMVVRVLPPADRQREASGEQPGLGGVRVTELLELVSHDLCRVQHGQRRLAVRPPGEQLRALGADRRPGAALLAEQPPGGPGVVDRVSRVAGGQARAGGHQERVGADVRVSGVPGEEICGLPSVAARIVRHSGRQQQPATIEIEIRERRVDGGQHLLGRVVMAQCRRQLTRAVGDVSPVVAGHG